jgi:hypothetical protein
VTGETMAPIERAGKQAIVHKSGSLGVPVPARVAGEPEAVFIVGVPRSGTTMMRYLLEATPRLAIGRENHYLGHYYGRRGTRDFFRQAGDLRDDATIRRIVEMLYGGEYARHSRWRDVSRFWQWLVASIPRDEMERRLLEGERSERGIFATVLRTYADAHGKPVFGEKTPTHLFHVPTLLEWFPDARIIHMQRDPRAVYVSDRHRRRSQGRKPYRWLARVPLLLEAYLLFVTLASWRRAMRLHKRYERAYAGRYLLVRFEDVLKRPAETLPALSTFLGVDVVEAAQRFSVPASHGMRSTDEGLDPAAADRWRDRIHPLARRIIELGLRGPMRRYGYTD